MGPACRWRIGTELRWSVNVVYGGRCGDQWLGEVHCGLWVWVEGRYGPVLASTNEGGPCLKPLPLD